MIEIYEREARGTVGWRNSSCLGYIGKLAAPKILK